MKELWHDIAERIGSAGEISFVDPSWLWIVAAMPIAFAMLAGEIMLARRGIRRLFARDLARALAGRASTARRLLRAALRCTAAALIALALARPGAPGEAREVELIGRDLVFLVDVSRSMLAEDLAPNRLERAKLWIRDMLELATGDRVAVVAFAGDAVVVAPLTNDMNFIRLAVEELSTQTVGLGGSRVGDAVRETVAQLFPDQAEPGGRYLILITDGEDQDSFPVEAARIAGDHGVSLIAVGIGDDGRGAAIPTTGPRGQQQFVRHEGRLVLSRLDARTLRDMAAQTPGGHAYIVATGNIRLDDVYSRVIAMQPAKQLGVAEAVELEEWFQIPLAAGILLLILEALIGETKRRPYSGPRPGSGGRHHRRADRSA